jgi:hypothetical protein
VISVGRLKESSAEKAGVEATGQALESRFSEAIESAFADLEKALKTTIYSTACGERLCARRMASFMAQIDRSAPHFAQLIRDTLEGFT